MPEPRTAPPPAKGVGQAAPPDASKAMILFVGVVAILYFGKAVLMPVTLALLLAFLLAPLVELLRRLHLGRVPSVLLGVIVALGVIAAIGGVIGEQVSGLSADIPKYTQTIERKITSARQYTLDRLNHIADSVGGQHQADASRRNEKAAISQASQAYGDASKAQASTTQAPPTTPGIAGLSSGSSPFALVERYLSPILSPLATFGIVFVVAVFALLQREDLRDRLIRLVGSDDLHRTTLAIDEGGRRLGRYYLIQLSINTVFGIVIGVGLLLIGVPHPVLWAILSALLRFVPYVGSFISAVLPMILAAAVEPGWSMTLWTAALYLVIESVTGQFIEPMVYGHSTGLSPFSVVVAAIFWSWLWGPVGLILSTPLTLCLVVMGRHVKRLEFLDVMLGDRPALTPVESFYQRILAGDPDEALDHAELLLKQRSLSTYYDEVALKALQLAANDAERGSLDHAGLDRIKSTVKALINGLEDHEDREPSRSNDDEEAIKPSGAEDALPRNPLPASAPRGDLPEAWRGASAVLCIAGKGPLDEAASSMLVQLLQKHGIGARLVGYGDVSREGIETLDTNGVTMACISYLDISGSPANLRYLVARLRHRLPPGAPVLVGLWPAEDAALTDKTIQATVGADYFTSSLQQAVSSSVEAALHPQSSNQKRFAALAK